LNLYEHILNEEEKTSITDAIGKVLHIEKAEATAGPHIDYKGGQITYSPVGIGAPDAMKKAYDPTKTRRQNIAAALRGYLPGYDIAVGGLSSIDVSKKGMNKSYGVSEVLRMKGLTPGEAVFMGDSLFPGGNDEPVRSTGVTCVQVSGPEDTARHIMAMLQ
jgi:phosphomannomutase